jgi:AhpD family alkylhydroperoxidase
MNESRKEIYKEINEAFGQVPGWIDVLPDAGLAGFWRLEKDFYLGETLIPNKYKELIGIAVSGATRCKYCVLFHMEGARLAGATEAEIAEAALMGSVTMMGSTFLNALGYDWDKFEKETREIVEYAKKQQAAQKKPSDRPEANA